MTVLDLGSLLGTVELNTEQFDTAYARVMQKMSDLSRRADTTATGTAKLDESFTATAESSDAAAAGISQLDGSLRAAAASASGAVGGLSQVEIANLRLLAAQDRLDAALLESNDLTGKLAGAYAAVASAANRVTAAEAKEAQAAQTASEAQARHAVAVQRVAAVTDGATGSTDALTAAQLRQVAAQARVDELMASGTATTSRLASAQASLIRANDAVAGSNERVAASYDTANLSGAAAAGRHGALRGVNALGLSPSLGAVLGIGGAVYEAAKFQEAVTRIHTQAGATVADTHRMAAGFLQMASAVATTPVELAAAGYHISSANQGMLSLSKQLHVLRLAAEGARLGGSDLVDTTNALDAAVVSGIPGVKNFDQAMGALNATVGAGDMTMQNLAEALGTGVLAVIKGYGVNLRQAGAALAVFGDNNIRGAMAGTQLRMAIQSLTVPSSAATAALEELGLTGKDAFTHFADDLHKGGLTLALKDLHDRLVASGVDVKGWGQILTEAFTKRAGAGINVLLQQYDRYQNKLDEVSGKSKSFAGDWQSYTHTFTYAEHAFVSELEALGITVGTKLLPDLTHALHWLTQFAHGFDGTSHSTRGAAKAGREASQVWKTDVVPILKDAWHALQDIEHYAGPAVAAIGGFAAHHSDVTKVAIELGLAAVAVHKLSKFTTGRGLGDLLRGGGGRLGGGGILGGISRAEPVPVYVTNLGPGGLGGPGGGGGPGGSPPGVLGRFGRLGSRFGPLADASLLDTIPLATFSAFDKVQHPTVTKSQYLQAAQTTEGVASLEKVLRQDLALKQDAYYRNDEAQIRAALRSVGLLTAAMVGLPKTTERAITRHNQLMAHGAQAFKSFAAVGVVNVGRVNAALGDFAGSSKHALGAYVSHVGQLQPATRTAIDGLLREVDTGKVGARKGGHALAVALLKSVPRDLLTPAGRDLVDGLIAGVNAKTDALARSMTSLANAAQASFARANESHSPSQVFVREGHNIIDGVIKGLKDRQHDLEHTVEQVATQLQNKRSARNSLQSTIFSALLPDITQFGTTNPLGVETGLRRTGKGEATLLRDLTLLKKRHFDPALLAQLASQGLGALPEVERLSKARRQTLDTIDTQFERDRRRAKAIAGFVGDDVYGKGIGRLEGRLHTLHEDLHDVNHHLNQVEHKLAELNKEMKTHPDRTGAATGTALDSVAKGAHHRRHGQGGNG